MKVRKFFVLAGSLSAAAAIATAPVSAATVGAAVFAGATGNLSPAVQLTGGSGSFSFAGTAAGAEVQPTVAAGAGTIGASGTYTNIVCGTGSVSATATVNAGVSVTAGVNILFVAAQGVITGTTTDGSTVAGYVVIVPTIGNCVSGVTQFTAAGAVAAA